MKRADPPSRKSRVDFKSDIFTISHAKSYLGRLIDKARNGETVYIVRGQDRFLLQQVTPIDPIPMRPPGYFENCYSKAEIREDNRLAKASVIRAPGDME